MKLIDCELGYLPTFHLMQIYSGFFELERKGIIRLSLKPVKKTVDPPSIVTAIFNKKHKVMYDTLDGLTWVPGDEQTNIEHFRDNIQADYYFKRSYTAELSENAPGDCKVYPLGLNYNLQPRKNLIRYQETVSDRVKYFLKTNSLAKSLTRKTYFYQEDFEFYPIVPEKKKVLFLTRLWDPADAKSEISAALRTQINQTRLECIARCREAYGDEFTGGLFAEKYALKHHAGLVAPVSLTSKKGFLDSVKSHAICIATTGLHKSIGWKFGEYVAASRAIVSEPLHFTLPGNFNSGKNFFEFDNADKLIEQINVLRKDEQKLFSMMNDNHRYYNNYVRPENMVLNTIMTVLNNGKYYS
jgi:hypothetical protein